MADDNKLDAVTANGAPLALDMPKPEVKAEPPNMDAASLIGPMRPEAPDNLLKQPAGPTADVATAAGPSHFQLPSTAPLAAGMALTAAIGAVAGAGAMLLVQRAAVAIDTRALQTTVARLDSEIAALNTGLNASQRSTTTQIDKLIERLDRTEKAQAEPAARLARLNEAVDRLEKRQQQQSAALAATRTPPSAALDPDATGSIMPYKEETRPAVAEGWRLRDFYSGRAVVESRNGMLFEVGPGSNLPGLGRVESIRRENGRVVVVARNGVITASFASRRPPAPVPYRY